MMADLVPPVNVNAAAAATTIWGGERVGEARVQPCVRSHGPGGRRRRRRAAAATTVIAAIAVVLVPNWRKMPPMRRQHRVQVGDGTEVKHEGMAPSDAPPPAPPAATASPIARVGGTIVGEAIVGEAILGETIVGEAIIGEAIVGEAIVALSALS